MNMSLKEPSSVLLQYFGVAEGYSSMQSTERPTVCPVYVSSCLSVIFLEFPLNIYHAAADVSLFISVSIIIIIIMFQQDRVLLPCFG
jgi:hypothetical protein